MKLPHTEDVPDYLWAAARVSRFMREERQGRWHLRHFTVTEEEFRAKVIHEQVSNSPERAALTVQRIVPPGDYITLRRRMIHEEKVSAIAEQFGNEWVGMVMKAKGLTEQQAIDHICPPERAWIPVMSDTPAEILEHDHALNNAEGVVVITGLGLGCLPHALLAKGDAIEHIHIIEIDPDVIRLTGKYLKREPKVTIHKGSATDIHKFLKEGTRVDYVWHDIWTHISSKNLRDETAEHGISYGRLFDLYGRWLDVGDTSAWALREATHQHEIEMGEKEEEMEFRRRLRAMETVEEQVEATYLRIMREKLPSGVEVEGGLEHLAKALDPDGSLKKHLHATLSEPGFWEKFDADMAEREKVLDRLGSPNAHLEGVTT